MSPLPNNEPLHLEYTVEQTDFFQFDFLEAYWGMLYERKHALWAAIASAVICSLAAAGILLSDMIVDQYLIIVGFFAVIFVGVNLYNLFFGYKHDYLQLQRLLERAVDAGRTVYPATRCEVDFGPGEVEVVENGGAGHRFFRYEDISYIEGTDRLYVIGLRPGTTKKSYLAEQKKLLVTKRFLSEDQREALEALLSNIETQFKLKRLLKEHPFN